MSEKQLAIHQPAEIAPVRSADVAGQLMQVIAANPTAGAENLKALLDGMERVTKWQAEQEFTAAFARLKFPPIQKTKKGHAAKYAPFDQVQEIIDPILQAEGFTLTFSSGEPNAKGEVPTFGLLSHVGGHSRQGVIYLPPDITPTRSGSTTMNALQQIGSSTSYGMRYVAKLMLNLRFVDEDNDGQGGPLDQAQLRLLREALMTVGIDESKMCEFATIKTLADLPAASLPIIKGQVNARYRKKLLEGGADEQEIQEKINRLWGGR